MRILDILIGELKFRAQNIGNVPICNCRRDRAPIFKGWSFLLCWRCTSIIIPLVGMRLFFGRSEVLLGLIRRNKIESLIVGVLMIMPTFIDGALQYGPGRESTNRRRQFTGFIAGYGLFTIKLLMDSLINP